MIALITTLQLLAAVNILPADTALISKTTDFLVTGMGDNAAWENATWQTFTKIDSGGKNYVSKSKMLYSDKGIYVLFTGEDEKISTKDYQDDDEIYEGDVFEFFLQADPSKLAYFEYEINQLNKQLILILSGIPNSNLAWSPWRHEYNRAPLVRKKVWLSHGTPKPRAAIGAWRAEIFFPYELLGLMPGYPPKSGMVWRANFCRIDYDSGKMIQYSWSKQIKSSFHELDHFGYIQFQ